MPTCFVPNCRSGYTGESTHTFRAHPTVAAKWIDILSKIRPCIPYNPDRHSICYKHFEPSLIIKEDTVVLNGKTESITRGRWKLVSNAVPTILPNPTIRTRNVKILKQFEKDEEKPAPLPTERLSSRKPGDLSDIVMCVPTGASTLDELAANWPDEDHPEWFTKMEKDHWHLFQVDFCRSVNQVTKHVEIKQDLTYRVFIGRREHFMPTNIGVNRPKLKSYEDVVDVLDEVSQLLNPCDGLRGLEPLIPCPEGARVQATFHSLSCARTIASDIAVCSACKQQEVSLQENLKTAGVDFREVRKLRQTLLEKKQRYREMSLKATRMNSRINRLLEQRRKLKSLKPIKPAGQFEDMLNSVDILDGVKMVVRAALSQTKVRSSTGIRYSSEWLDFAKQLIQRSNVAYEFLKSRGILPLPTSRTLLRFKGSSTPKQSSDTPPEGARPPVTGCTYDFFDEVVSPTELCTSTEENCFVLPDDPNTSTVVTVSTNGDSVTEAILALAYMH